MMQSIKNTHSKVLGLLYIVFNDTFNNISVLSLRSALLVVENEVLPGGNYRPVTSHGQTLSHNVESSTLPLSGIGTHNVSGELH